MFVDKKCIDVLSSQPSALSLKIGCHLIPVSLTAKFCTVAVSYFRLTGDGYLAPSILSTAGLLQRRKEGNDLFNDALNTFFNLRLYGIGHLVKDHSHKKNNQPGNLPWSLHGLLFLISSKGSIIAHTSLCYTSCGTLAGTSKWLNG